MNTKHLFLCAALALAPAALAQDGKNAIAGSCTIDANTPAKLNQNNLLASCNPSVNIPLGKRMVIEQASAVCMFDASGTPPLISRFSLGVYRPGAPGAYTSDEFTLTEFSTSTGAGPNNLSRRTSRAILKGPLYTDLAPKFEVERFGGYVTYAWCTLSVSGFLVDKLAL